MTLRFLLILCSVVAMGSGFAQNPEAESKEAKAFESLDCTNSSAIELARYYPATERLELAFKSRPSKIYTYDYFPRDIWLMWNAAESKGQFHLRNVKGQKFRRPEKSGSDQ